MLRNRRVCSVAAFQRNPMSAFSGDDPAPASPGRVLASAGAGDEDCSCWGMTFSGMTFSTAPDETSVRGGVGEALATAGASDGLILPGSDASGAARSAPGGGGGEAES